MVTVAQMNTFWTGAGQMALDALIVAILPNHGITDFASFEDFDDAAILAIMRQVNRDPALPDFGQHSYMRFCTAC